MWLISEDRKRAINTETKVEIHVDTPLYATAEALPRPPGPMVWFVKSGSFVFATCEREHDAIEALVAITLLTMDTVVARTSTGLTYKRCDIHSLDIDEYLAASIKDIIQRGIKNNS